MSSHGGYNPPGKGIRHKHDIKKGFVHWAIPWSLFAAASGMMLYVYLINYPFWGRDELSASYASGMAWLITLNTTIGESSASVKFGFGTWGWCEWSNDPDVNTVARCYGGGVWRIPLDAGPESRVSELALPASITQRLSPGSVPLFLPFLTSLYFLVLASCALRYHPPYDTTTQPPRPIAPPKNPSVSDFLAHLRRFPATRYQCACILATPWITLPIWGVSALCSLPAIALSASARAHYRGIEGVGYDAEMGQGAICLAVVIVAELAGWGWHWWTGGWMNRHASYKEREPSS